MDDEEVQIVKRPDAQRHDKWSYIILAVDLAGAIAIQVADTLDTATTLLLQHREHKIVEREFYQIVGGIDDDS